MARLRSCLALLLLLLMPAPALAQYDVDDDEQYEADRYWERRIESRKAEVEGDLSTSLDARYRFCHDLESRVLEGDAALCDLKQLAKERCPGFAEACEKPFVESAAQRRRRAAREEPELKMPAVSAAVGAVAQVAFWALVIALALFLVWAILKGARAQAKVPDPASVEPPAGSPEEEAARLARRRVETDVERLLRRAQAEAEAGRFEQALADAHAALLRHLEGHGYIDMHPSRTNGEYASKLREHPELSQAVKQSARELEAVQFGARPPAAATFHAVMERVVMVVSRGAGFMLALCLAWASLGCDALVREPTPGPGDEASGFSLLGKLLTKRGATLSRHQGDTALPLDEGVGVVVVHGSVDLASAEWERLRDWASAGGTLIIALSTSTQGFTTSVSQGSPAPCGSLQVAPAYTDYLGLKVAAPGGSWLVATDDYWPVLQCVGRDGSARPHVVAGSVGSGSVVILPGSALLTNASMVSGDHAFIVLELLFGVPEQVLFVDAHVQAGEDSPLAAVAESRLGPMLLQLFALMALFYWWRGKHLSRPERERVARRRAFSEHVVALGNQYRKAGASRMAVGMYAGWVIERLRERVLPGKGGSLSALAAAVAAKSGRPEGEVLRVLVEGDSARDAVTAPGDQAEDHRIMRELDRLLSEAGGRVGR